MAKVVLTIEDTPDGNVKMTSEPSFETLAMMSNSGYELTSAHGYALLCINTVRKASKEQGKLKPLIPRIGRP